MVWRVVVTGFLFDRYNIIRVTFCWVFTAASGPPFFWASSMGALLRVEVWPGYSFLTREDIFSAKFGPANGWDQDWPEVLQTGNGLFWIAVHHGEFGFDVQARGVVRPRDCLIVADNRVHVALVAGQWLGLTRRCVWIVRKRDSDLGSGLFCKSHRKFSPVPRACRVARHETHDMRVRYSGRYAPG